MKKINLWAALAAFILLSVTACNNDDDPEPTAATMSGVEITGAEKAFEATVTFSEAVYANADKTGDLTKESFSVSVEGGAATIDDYTVSQTAGESTAKINLTMSDFPSGEEMLSVTPASATSIYNAAAKAMSTDNFVEANFNLDIVVITDNGEGTGTITWTKDKVYILNGLVFVNNGQILTIESGTVIKGMPGQGEEASALVIAKGGKIMAEGTADNPIIFTAEADDLEGSIALTEDGLWGGIIVLGDAVLNTVPGEQQIEGIAQTEARGTYGGNNDADNSGILKYISIRHGGTDIGEGNEINGLTLGGVGSATTIEYIEVISNKDDGVEFFGGKPNLNHIIVAFCGDDSFDYDQGFRGNGQFWAAIQGYERGDRLGEHDGGTNPEAGEPYAIPTIYNVTYLGRGDGAGKKLVTFRDNAGGHYGNSIFYSQEKGVDIELLVDQCSYNQFSDENLTLKNNLFFSISADPIFNISATDDVPATEVETANNIVAEYFTTASNQVYDPGFNVTENVFNIIPTNAVNENMAATPSDSFFQNVNYKGAFDPSSNWAEGWTLVSTVMN